MKAHYFHCWVNYSICNIFGREILLWKWLKLTHIRPESPHWMDWLYHWTPPSQYSGICWLEVQENTLPPPTTAAPSLRSSRYLAAVWWTEDGRTADDDHPSLWDTLWTIRLKSWNVPQIWCSNAIPLADAFIQRNLQIRTTMKRFIARRQ